MALTVAVQMDPIQRINVKGDSTFALLLEAQKRGHVLSYYTPDRLAQLNGRLFAGVEALSVRDQAGDHFTLGAPARVVRTLTPEQAAGLGRAAKFYAINGPRFKKGLKKIG